MRAHDHGMDATLTTIHEGTVQRFLAGHRFAVVGASGAKGNFGATIVRTLRDRGDDVVAVNPLGQPIDGRPCEPDLASVEGELDGVIVMVPADRAVDVVRDCIDHGVRRVWLFRGFGGPGAMSDEAVELCDAAGIEVVAGACPLMFIEPVGLGHRLHRAIRRRRRSLVGAY